MEFSQVVTTTLQADSYYTFTGEMMSDFLANREDFSQFKRIVERAGRMDLLASRGARTLFPPVNSGVEAFLKRKRIRLCRRHSGLFCDTLVKSLSYRTNVVHLPPLLRHHQKNHPVVFPLIMVTNGDTVDANQMVLTVINRRAAIINELKNDSVENGVVHPVDKVLVPNTSLGASLLDENHEDFTIFYEALKRTALLDSLSRYRDDGYEEWKNNYAAFTPSMRIGNENYVGKRPDHRYSGFTLLIVPTKYFTRNTATASTRA